jgi:hypothetical protein
VADEKDGESGSILRRPWDLMVSTIVRELFFLAIPALFAAGPVGELYRTGPPRRLAAAVALLATMTVITLFGAAAGWTFPPLADHKIGLLAGFLVGAPVGAAVFALYSNGAKDA